MAEFSYNYSIHASTKVSPFFANYGFHPRLSISIPATLVNPSEETRARTLHDVHCDLSLELRVVGNQYKDKADRYRLTTQSDVCSQGHGLAVTLPHRHYMSLCKIELEKTRPFPYHRVDQPTRLPVSTSSSTHDVFHVSLLDGHDGM